MQEFTHLGLGRQVAIAVLAVFMGLLASAAVARDQTGSAVPSRTGVSIPGIEIDTQFAPIKSRAQLHDYMSANPGPKNPLFPLSNRDQKKFLRSLVFTDKGLASFDTEVLQSSLTPSQIYHLLSLFGLQRAAHTFTDARIESEVDRAVLELGDSGQPDVGAMCVLLDGMACRRPATCYQSINEVCVTCNCSMP